MFMVKNNIIPEAFRTKLQIVQHKYLTAKLTLKDLKYLQGNLHNDRFFKTITSVLLLKAKPKEYLVKLRNVTSLFNKSLN